MSDLVIFKLGETAQDAVHWASFASGVLVETGHAENVSALSGLNARFDDNVRRVAILRGEQVAIREFAAPPKNSSKLLSAASLLLEDELAEPVSELQIVVSADEPRAALAISKPALESWLAAFDEAGVAITEACADFCAIGGSTGTVVFAGDENRVIASRGAAGFAAEAALAGAAAPSLIAAAGDAAVIAYGPNDFVSGWTERPVEFRRLSSATDLLAIFGAALSMKPSPVNLLQGVYRRRAARNFRLGPYRRAGILAAGLAAAAVVSAAAAGVRDARVEAVYGESSNAMHRAAFPTFSGGDIRAHARQMLAEGVKSASFLEMTGRLTAGLEGNEAVAIDRIRFDAARGQYLFSIRSGSDAAIESFRASLEQKGLTATDSGGYRRSGDAWVGEMSVKAK